MPGVYKIKKVSQLHAELRVPGDKSISHRAAILASLSNGPCLIRGFLPSEDCLCTLEALRSLGVKIERPDDTTLVVHGCKGVFQAPADDIYCGNSGTAMRLLTGLLAAQPFESRLTGDASLSRRPMKRVMQPLSEMGATIHAEGADNSAPLVIRGGPLTPIEYRLPIASAQVKSAILLAGLHTRGKTTVIEPGQSRDHTERMLNYFLVRTSREVRHVYLNPDTQEEIENPPPEWVSRLQKRSEYRVSIHGDQRLESRDFRIPGDISSAAFWLVAAAARLGSRVLIEDVGLNETRTGILSVLLRMGARIREVIEDSGQVERIGSVEVKGAELRGTTIAGAEIPNVIDELPILAVAGALATGTTIIRDAKELRVKETDRIAAVAQNLRAMGVDVEEKPDGMEIHGGKPLRGARLPSFGDHRIAMAFSIAGLFAQGETLIEDVACVDTSYPGFEEHLQMAMTGRPIRLKPEVDPVDFTESE